ncbi:hypothetical protein Q9233_006105 [Columba guinea]|nr:hypothetical protein Q9233_006105 [Columba guinea]
MGTPASVVSDPPGRVAPAARCRKRASANIFQGVGLPELRSLFRSGGAELPEERARLVWRIAEKGPEDRCGAQAHPGFAQQH